MDTRRKVFTGKVVEAPKGKPIVAVVSSSAPDLIGDVIVPGKNARGSGWILDDFNARGRVYWMHDPFRPNLAKARASVRGDELWLEVAFDTKDAFAAELDRKYREGFLTEWSVGFRAVDGKYDEHNESGGWTFYEQHLDEVSAVNQGMHPDTRTVSKAYADYADTMTEVRVALDGYDKRLREIEAAVMRADSERAEDRLRAALQEISQIRSRA